MPHIRARFTTAFSVQFLLNLREFYEWEHQAGNVTTPRRYGRNYLLNHIQIGFRPGGGVFVDSGPTSPAEFRNLRLLVAESYSKMQALSAESLASQSVPRTEEHLRSQCQVFQIPSRIPVAAYSD